MNMINKDFANLPQRCVYYFLATYPSFTPIASEAASTREQENAHGFIKSIYERLYDDPALLNLKAIPDDWFNDWELYKSQPTLAPKIRGIIAKIEEFISVIFTAALLGKSSGDTITVDKSDIIIKPSQRKQLESFNVSVTAADTEYSFAFPKDTASGLVLLAKISQNNVKPPKDGKQKPYLLFSRGVFDANAPYTQEIFGNMLDDRTAFDKLIAFLDENNYQRIDNKEYNNQISLDYVKNYGDPNAELKATWAERTRGGIEVIYEETRKNQPLFSLRIPYFDELLKQADKMNVRVKRFVTSTSKKCDGCRYCVQTDKSGKRPLACIDVDEYKICPHFCGFQYRYKTLDAETVDNMIEMLSFIDEIFKHKQTR